MTRNTAASSCELWEQREFKFNSRCLGHLQGQRQQYQAVPDGRLILKVKNNKATVRDEQSTASNIPDFVTLMTWPGKHAQTWGPLICQTFTLSLLNLYILKVLLRLTFYCSAKFLIKYALSSLTPSAFIGVSSDLGATLPSGLLVILSIQQLWTLCPPTYAQKIPSVPTHTSSYP